MVLIIVSNANRCGRSLFFNVFFFIASALVKSHPSPEITSVPGNHFLVNFFLLRGNQLLGREITSVPGKRDLLNPRLIPRSATSGREFFCGFVGVCLLDFAFSLRTTLDIILT